MGMLKRSDRRVLRKHAYSSGDSPIFTANLARAHVGTNRKADAVELLNDLKPSSIPGYPPAAEIATVYTALGDKDHVPPDFWLAWTSASRPLAANLFHESSQGWRE